MGETFTSVAFEVYISSAWVDLTDDVMATPPPSWNRGIMGNSQIDRIGSPGYLTFDLNNSDTNSAGLLGYYSPGHTNSLAGWTTGLPVRLSFTYDGFTYYKFYGKIAPDGINIDVGVYGARRAHVTVVDYMAQAAKHELQLLTLQENKTIDEVMPYIIANMPVAPLATDYEAGENTFPTVFDTIKGKTTAIAEFQKLANSELSTIYAKGDMTGGETLVAEAQLTRYTSNTDVTIGKSAAGYLLKEDGYKILKEDGGGILLNQTQKAEFDESYLGERTQFGYGRNLANRVEVTTYPRKVDAAATTVLWSLQSEFSIAAGQTKTGYYCRYRDPSGGASYVNGRNMVTPQATTDYTANAASGGGGADKTAQLGVTATFGTEAVSFDLVNNDAGTIYVTKLQVRGKGIYLYDPVRVVYDDSTSQATHGVYTLNVDMKYQDDPAVGEAFAATLLAREKDPDYTCDQAEIWANRDQMTMFAFMELETGKRLSLNDTMTGTDRDYFIQGYRAEIREKNQVFWLPVLQWAGSSTGLWVLGSSVLGVNTTLG